jgi:mannose-1-phosphate guanylyltransferase
MSEKNIQVLILAGGLGTRLKPITETIPKPMVDICGKPFLEYKIEQIKNYGIKKIILCTGYLGNIIENYFGDGKKFGVDLRYSNEKELLGTAGAVKNAESLIETDPFIVMNGDTYLNLDLRDLIFSHKKNNSLVTMVIANATNPLEQELIEMENGFITKFHKRGTAKHKNYLEKTPNPLINAGIYVFDKKILNLISPDKKISLEKEIFPELLFNISGFKYNGYMKDLANTQFCRELEKDLSGGLK